MSMKGDISSRIPPQLLNPFRSPAEDVQFELRQFTHGGDGEIDPFPLLKASHVDQFFWIFLAQRHIEKRFIHGIGDNGYRRVKLIPFINAFREVLGSGYYPAHAIINLVLLASKFLEFGGGVRMRIGK